jgi:hypothetical protein
MWQFGRAPDREWPGDLRRLARQNVLAENIEECPALENMRSRFRTLRQWATVGRVLIIVAIVANVGVRGPAPEVGSVESVANILIHLPGDFRFLQQFAVRRPPLAEFGVIDDRPASAPIIAYPTRAHVVPVRIGLSQ